ncbi:putative fungal lipase-like domain, alpha/Beta hydrolase [Dioscorea sansibarensis]
MPYSHPHGSKISTAPSTSISTTRMEPFSPLLLPSKPPDLAQAPPDSNPKTMAFIGISALRRTTILVGTLNIAVAIAGTLLVALLLRRCGARLKFSIAAVSIAAAVKVGCMLATGIAQGVMASSIARRPIDGSVREDIDFRRERKMRYRRWLWWTRIGSAVTILQFVGALYLMLVMANSLSYYESMEDCFLGKAGKGGKHTLMVSYLILVWLVVIIQCFTGSDVLRWRSFYATHDTAWKAHYQEVFDYGIREALCCLGRMKYLSVLEEDEVYSVARLLGDLVAYRASGTGHLELLAGLALLQKHKNSPKSCSELIEAPEERVRDAAAYHQFAEAAYTGPLLDLGRNPVLFPCVWLHRQGVLTPWSRTRRPMLEGDNWWRGHAAAFLKYVRLSPNALRRGRVSQTKREAAYFIVVLHDQKVVVITVRGTETPEDLLTDGLCRECTLSMADLDGSDHLHHSVRERVLISFPHYGHSGIVESARELFMQIDGQPGDDDNLSTKTTGFLSSLLGVGCECQGYQLRLVGHSLGGAVATLLGIRLYRRYPNLHVYAYGTLPCVDFIVAEACSDFVTTIVYNDEFSARLSVNSILRLRSAAITALSDSSSADKAVIFKLARKFLANKYPDNRESHNVAASSFPANSNNFDDNNNLYKRRPSMYTNNGSNQLNQDLFQGEEASFANGSAPDMITGIFNENKNAEVLSSSSSICGSGSFKQRGFESTSNLMSYGELASQIVDNPPSIEVSAGETPEMYLPGLIIHLLPEPKNLFSLWRGWSIYNRDDQYNAFVADRESFKDIIVSPYMFLDHLPWRCHTALQRVLQNKISQSRRNDDLFNEVVIV